MICLKCVSIKTHGNEEVWHAAFVLQPSFTVLSAAALDITQGTVSDHEAEEDGVEPRERAPVVVVSFCLCC